MVVACYSLCWHTNDMLSRFIEKYILQRPEHRPIKDTLIIDLAAILLWRGVWGLLDIYLFPEIPQISFIASIVVAILLMLALRFSK